MSEAEPISPLSELLQYMVQVWTANDTRLPASEFGLDTVTCMSTRKGSEVTMSAREHCCCCGEYCLHGLVVERKALKGILDF